jgi:ribosomal protein S18 acetylase RimI-like enzyme
MLVTSELGGWEASYLALEAQASEPYTAFVYEDPAEAARVQRLLFERDVGDLARRFGRLAMVDGQPAGMLACIPGDQLAATRLKAALVLRKAGVFEAPGTARRSSLAGPTLAKLGPEDFYLSRISVDQAHRGRGIGRELLAFYEAEGRRLGARRLILEVSPAHREAMRLYERAGFAITGGGEAEDRETARRLVYHHMTKQLTG